MDAIRKFLGIGLTNGNYDHIDMHILTIFLIINSFILIALVTAFKELLMEGKLQDSIEVNSPALTANLGSKFVYQYSGVIGAEPKKIERAYTSNFL